MVLKCMLRFRFEHPPDHVAPLQDIQPSNMLGTKCFCFYRHANGHVAFSSLPTIDPSAHLRPDDLALSAGYKDGGSIHMFIYATCGPAILSPCAPSSYVQDGANKERSIENPATCLQTTVLTNAVIKPPRSRG